MPKALRGRREYLRRYLQDFPEHKLRAELAEGFVRSILENTGIDIHNISSRAKAPDSVQLKILKKGYKRPERELTDHVGVRVITYYARDIDRIVNLLKGRLDIDPKRSVDKKAALGTRAYGYSSVHLIGKLRQKDASGSQKGLLAGLCFEIQVRSILEHAWAEIEHEVVYKSGISYPKGIDRRFAAIAGTLEMLGSEFLSLKSERNKLIASYRRSYEAGLDGRKSLDAARLLAFLECEYPQNPSWRQREEIGEPFPPRIEATCVTALAACGMKTANALRAVMRSRRYARAARTFAAAEMIEPSGVSHLALVLVAVALRKVRVLEDYFPAMRMNPGLAAVVSRQAKEQ